MDFYLPAINVAKYLLYRANIDGETITNLKLQKLLYYAQGWYLANFDVPLFEDNIYAWKYGPIVEAVYRHYKHFRYSPIAFQNSEKIEKNIPAPVKKYLDDFYGVFIRFSASDLTQASHNEDPWKNTKQSAIITKESILKFFKKELDKIRGAQKA
jgi:uncharacterized phage-associated protein